jgi:hypothetical protein
LKDLIERGDADMLMHPSPNCHWSANDRYTPQALIHYIISEHQVLEETLEEGGDDSEAETTRDSVNDNEGYFTRTITQRIPNPRTIPWTRMTGEFTGKMTSTKHYFASTSCVTYNSVCLIKISGHSMISHGIPSDAYTNGSICTYQYPTNKYKISL